MSSARILREAPRGDSISSGNVGMLGGVQYFTLVNEQFVNLEPCLSVDENEGECTGRRESGAEGARGQVGWSGARTVMLCQRERVGIEELEEVVRSAWRVISNMMRGGCDHISFVFPHEISCPLCCPPPSIFTSFFICLESVLVPGMLLSIRLSVDPKAWTLNPKP
jgi:hypothetical protein